MSHIKSRSFGLDTPEGLREFLFASVHGGEELSDEEILQGHREGRISPIGKFSSPARATRSANALSRLSGAEEVGPMRTTATGDSDLARQVANEALLEEARFPGFRASTPNFPDFLKSILQPILNPQRKTMTDARMEATRAIRPEDMERALAGVTFQRFATESGKTASRVLKDMFVRWKATRRGQPLEGVDLLRTGKTSERVQGKFGRPVIRRNELDADEFMDEMLDSIAAPIAKSATGVPNLGFGRSQSVIRSQANVPIAVLGEVRDNIRFAMTGGSGAAATSKETARAGFGRVNIQPRQIMVKGEGVSKIGPEVMSRNEFRRAGDRVFTGKGQIISPTPEQLATVIREFNRSGLLERRVGEFIEESVSNVMPNMTGRAKLAIDRLLRFADDVLGPE